jgi:hypothetical protein
VTSSRPFTEQLANALRCFEDSRGYVTLRARTLLGYEERYLGLTPPFTAGVPVLLLHLLADPDWSVRLIPFSTDSAHTPRALPALTVLWRPETEFRSDLRRHVVTDAGAEVIRGHLARLPRPSLLIDGAHEVLAAWRLTTPIADLGYARQLLTRAAMMVDGVRLEENPCGAEAVPFAGAVRNWNTTEPETITIEVADPARRYALADLEKGIFCDVARTDHGPHSVREGGRQRTRRA